MKVNGYSINAEDGVLTLLVSIYDHSTQAGNTTKTEVQNALVRGLRTFRRAVDGLHETIDSGTDQYCMLERMWQTREDVSQVRIILLTNGLVQDTSLEEGPPEGTYSIKYQIWDIRRLFRCEVSGLPYESIEVNLEDILGVPLPCIDMPDHEADHRVYLTIMPATLLGKLYDEYGGRLLELNVRSFLQARGKVNRGIRDTIRNEPARFLAYNNGLSLTAERLIMGKTADGSPGIRSIIGMQIVNGGQTVASIHSAQTKDKADLSNIFVQAKLTVVVPGIMEDLVPKVSRFANTQNRVSEADFSSNDPYHVELQRLAESVWAPGEQSRWFYERARGQYQVAKAAYATTPARRRRFESEVPSRQKFTKTDLAKYLNSWDMLPDIVSKGTQKNFVDFMSRLRKRYGTDWKPDQDYYRAVIGKAILFKQTETVARELKLPAYRANAIAYTVAYLVHRTVNRIDLSAIWLLQDISSALRNTIREWMPSIYAELTETAGERNVTEWCKREECWRTIQMLVLTVPDDLQTELAEGQPLPTVGSAARRRSDALTEQDRENIAKVMRVPGETWLNIHGWGARSGQLEPKQAGIALTLGGYAASGWQHVPSAKQAWHGVKILELAEENANEIGRRPDEGEG